MTLEERVEKLERSARRWRAAAVALGLLGLAGAAQNAPDTIKARHFEVVDERGKPAATLGSADGLTQLALYDRAGHARIRLSIDRSQTALVGVRGAPPGPRSDILLIADTRNPPEIVVYYKEQKQVVKAPGN